ncbi:hypothetical protein [Yersinia phage MHG19]|nr:hypothetical protein [Yersinia phage MHG19]
MRKYWITLITGEYGFMYADAPPLPGTYVTITVRNVDGTRYKTTGMVSKVEN